MEKILVGIDPGANTGFAIWNKSEQKFINILTLSFWEAITHLKELRTRHHLGLEKLEVFIEDVTQNKPIFHKDNRPKSGQAHDRISSNVGMNKRDCQLIIEWCQINDVKLTKVRPTKKSFTKLSKEEFKKITGYEGMISEHARDAAMLVFGR